MKNNFYHPELLQTPEGVRDIYGAECAAKENVQRSIQEIINNYGFEYIQTPAFEYFDIFNKERGSVASNVMFKFFDRDNNTLVLRPDITPSIARSVAKYYEDENMPIRLCYTGNTYTNSYSHQGKLKETTQVGAELINDDTSDADAEMIVMTIECLLKAGLTEFQIDVGHADFFNGIAECAGLNPLQIKELKEMLMNKNVFAIKQYLADIPIDENTKELLAKMPEMFGTNNYIEFARAKVCNEKSLKALDRLEKLYNIIDSYGCSQYVSLDFGMISSYTYYTGIIFRAYTYGTGEPVATGGRYDSLLSQFGHDGAAIGVAICIDQLMLAMQRQKIAVSGIEPVTIMLYEPSERNAAIATASRLRNDGMRISMLRKSHNKDINTYIEYAKRIRVADIIFIKDSLNASVIETATGKESRIALNELTKKEVLS